MQRCGFTLLQSLRFLSIDHVHEATVLDGSMRYRISMGLRRSLVAELNYRPIGLLARAIIGGTVVRVMTGFVASVAGDFFHC